MNTHPNFKIVKRYTGFKLILGRVFFSATVLMLTDCEYNNHVRQGPANASVWTGMEQFKELESFGKVAPKKSLDISDSRWGVEFWELDSLRDIDNMIEKIAESGVKWARFRTGGYFDVSAEAGYFRWRNMDRIINGLAENKIHILFTVCRRRIDLSGSDISAGLEDYLDALTALVKRYKTKVTYWEIMNEPDITPVYFNAVKEASKIIKRIDPDARVIAGSLARGQFKRIRKLVKETGPYIDIITFHPYNEFPEAIKYRIMVPVAGAEGSYAPASMTFKEFRKQLGDDSTRIELWNGEGGYPSSEHTDSWKGRGPWGENIQAKWLLRRFLVDYSLNVPVMIYFYFPESSPVNSHILNAKGLFDLENDRLKQGYKALQHMTSIFDQRLNTPKQVNHDFEIIDEGCFLGIRKENNKNYLAKHPPYENAKSPIPVELVGLTGNEDNAVAYWLPWRMQEVVFPARVNLFVRELTIENPVLVDLLTGVVYHTMTEKSESGMIFRELPLTDYPMAIVPENLVKIKEVVREEK